MSRRLDPFLYHLDDIEQQARREHGSSTAAYLDFIVREFLKYWRLLQSDKPAELEGQAWVRLCLLFELKLREIAYARFDLEWLIFEYDGEPLYNDNCPRPPPRKIHRRH
ncbi:hypothetical protein SAMN02745729_13110 [Marinobacterium iners DSM 11526]|uniref:Uncharacterized protein n=1 Tax=Marinobacterium iners DSM 11526 TaxID=1122198 RepID=A0A1H4H831_9GAMM|nr:hypothetical protein SAMN02745729_13110 [Marinobacterium iners DSM 11526]